MVISKEDIRNKILLFNKNGILKGLATNARLDCLIHQIMDSIERVKRTTNPLNNYFNPIYLAKLHKEQGNIDEACYLTFLSVHFGENDKTGWNLLRNVYYALGSSPYWSWDRTTSNVDEFSKWVQSNKETLQANGSFGNHRKYEKLDGHTAKTIASYIDWIGGSHVQHFHSIQLQVGANPHILFDALYKSMNRVWRFGRTARFDYLCLLGKLGIADIEPGHPYLHDATGPLEGAKLLFGGKNTYTLNNQMRKLGECLDLRFTQQVIEDAVCNWQKSPDNFISLLPATY